MDNFSTGCNEAGATSLTSTHMSCSLFVSIVSGGTNGDLRQKV